MNNKKSNVLALKYRPSDFKDLIGQEYLVETIKKAMQLNKLPNAYIFTGIRGVGKTTTARIVAKMLNCTVFDDNKNPVLKDCDQAIAIAEDRHPDVIEIDAASNTSVDNAREIIENVKYSPVMGKFRVYIIDEVHMLSKSAFNSLLKTLEEPPAHAKFIFATTEISKVPITILSRCQRFDLRRINKQIMLDYLKNITLLESITITNEAMLMIIKAGDGSVRDCLSILDQANIFKINESIGEEDIVKMLGFARRADIYEIVLQIISNQNSQLLNILNDMYERGTEINKVLEELMETINWSLKLKINPSLLNDSTLTEEDKKFADKIVSVDQGKLSIFWQSLMKGYEEVKISPSPHLTLEMILLRSCYLLSKDEKEDLEEKKKSKIQNELNNKRSIKLDPSAEDESISLQEKVEIHQRFFEFYGNKFSPLMASLILENAEIKEFHEIDKQLTLETKDINFEGFKELKLNLKDTFNLTIKESKDFILLQDLKELCKQELIKEEMGTEDFKKVLAKFPNAKIVDIEPTDRRKNNDG